MRQLFFCSSILLVSFATAPVAHAEPTELFLAADLTRCQQSASDALDRGGGIANVTLFIEGSTADGALCFLVALELASRALISASGREHPADLAGGSNGARRWFDRPTATFAALATTRTIWPPPPPSFEVSDSWLFLAVSDLSGHWHWIAIDNSPPGDRGEVRVRVWSER